MISPVSSTAPIRSASPSKAMPELRAGPPDLGLEVAQVLGDRRIGMVVREGPVRLAEQRRDLGAEPLEGGDGDEAPGAVAAVDDHAHRPRQPVAAEDPFAISLVSTDAVARLPSRTGPPALGDDALPELEDLLAVEGLPGEDHLEAVELGRIVRPGDLHARVRPERVDAEVERRRGQRAYVDRRPAGLDDPAPDRWPRAHRPTAGCRVPRPPRAPAPAAPTRRWRRRARARGRARA